MEVTLADLQLNYAGKADDELLRLYAAGTLTDIAYEALEAELAKRNVPVPARPAPPTETELRDYERRMSLAAHWRGQASLASAYWLVGHLGVYMLVALTVLVYKLVPALTPVASLAVLALMVFAWVSIWRCWKNTRWPVWGYIARGMVILYVAQVGAVLVALLVQLGGQIASELPRASEQRSLLE
jgi:hypothetical protein